MNQRQFRRRNDPRREREYIKIREGISNLFYDLDGGGKEFGAWIDENSRSNGFDSGDLIECPAYVIESILRDIMDVPTDNINYASFDSAGNTTDGTLKDWSFTGGIYEVESSKNILENILMQCKSQLYRDAAGKFKLIVYNSSASVDYTDYDFNIDNHITNIQISETSYNDIVSHVRINYALDRGSGEFTKCAYIQAKKEFSGSYLDGDVSATLDDWDVTTGANFSATNFILTEREVNLVDSIASNTLTLDSLGSARLPKYSSVAQAHLDGTPIYIISSSSDDGNGSTADSTRETAAKTAVWKYNATAMIEIDADWIIDKDTAVLLRNYYFDYYSEPHYIVDFDCTLMASDVEVGNIIEFDSTIMDAYMKLGGASWSGKKFRVEGISRNGAMSYHITAVEI